MTKAELVHIQSADGTPQVFVGGATLHQPGFTLPISETDVKTRNAGVQLSPLSHLISHNVS